jgi:hypothetical protein
MLWQRHLYENAVHIRIGIQLVDSAKEIRLLCGRRQTNRFALYSGFLRSLSFSGNVRSARCIIANKNYRQAWARSARNKSFGFFRNTLPDAARNRGTVDQLSGQSPPNGFPELAPP